MNVLRAAPVILCLILAVSAEGKDREKDPLKGKVICTGYHQGNITACGTKPSTDRRHRSIALRRAWAEEMGYEFGDTFKIEGWHKTLFVYDDTMPDNWDEDYKAYRHVDIWFDKKKNAVAFGKRLLKIEKVGHINRDEYHVKEKWARKNSAKKRRELAEKRKNEESAEASPRWEE
jgi:3D (Asp-Asp-Asp) domain-containing protein